MGFDKKAYSEYEEKLYALTYGGDFSNEIINELFSQLLSVLPNNGKLYKYKSLKSFHLDELEEKYVWLSSAKYLNDSKDCTFNADFFKDVQKIANFMLLDDNYRRLLIMGFVNRYQSKGITYDIIDDCFGCLLQNTGKIGIAKFNNLCRKYNLPEAQIAELKAVINQYIFDKPDEDRIKGSVINMFQQIIHLRDQQHILSLTTSYKKDSMWAYYCNNKGICVEYDFSKINSLALKRVFLNTQKVRYGKKKRMSYSNIFKLAFTGDKDDKIKADKLTMDQLLTKDKSWMTEDEWRVLFFEKGNELGIRVPADIISSIYIDYSILKYKKTKQIINIAKMNNWNVYVRFFDDLNIEYRYETIEETNKTIKYLNELGLHGVIRK